MSSSFFGELYLRSTRPFLGNEVSDHEAEYLVHAFDGSPTPGPIVDLGCGHGRHAARMVGRLAPERTLIGIDVDALSLREREGSFPAVRGDLKALPFRAHSMGGAFAWYSTLFVFDDEVQNAILGELSRCLRPGARLVFQTSPLERLEKSPTAQYEGVLPDGSRLEEESRFDPESSRDVGFRKLTTPDGRVLSAQYFIRYYRVPELTALLRRHGFEVLWIHGGLSGEPLTEGSTDLIMGVQRNG